MENLSEHGLGNNPLPLFSVVILCWNNLKYLEECLQALADQTWKDFEVILIDNGSDEPVPGEMLANYPGLDLKCYKLEQNIGFAAGNNHGAKYAKGEYLVTLNADAFPRPDWLEKIEIAVRKYPGCSLASKLIMANDHERLDGEGDVYHISGLAWRRSYNTLVSKSKVKEGEVFSACGAAAVYPRKAFDEVGGFDPDYFAYFEDVDLGFRLRLAGYGCMYIPEAVVYHVGSGSTSKRSNLAVYYGHRNLVWTFFKDMPLFLVIIIGPLHLLVNITILIQAAFRRQLAVTSSAKMHAVKDLALFIRKRKEIQVFHATSLFNLARSFVWDPFLVIRKFLCR